MLMDAPLPPPIREVAALRKTRLFAGVKRPPLPEEPSSRVPTSIPERSLLIAMAFGVVLFSLVVQAISLPFVVRRAGLARPD